MSNLRVLHFYRTYFPATHGGAEEAIRQICISTSVDGVTNRILTLAPVSAPQVITRPEAEVHQYPLQWEPASCSMGMSAFRAYSSLAAWADVIHIHYPWPFADLVHSLVRPGKPVIITYHSDIVRQTLLELVYSPLRKLFFRSVDRFVATSPNYVKSSTVLRRLGQRVTVIPLGLEESSYPQPSSEVLDKVESQFGRNFFLFIGVLRYYKGLRTLLEAAEKVNVSIVIAGKGPEESDLKALSQKYGLENVSFAGFVDDETKQALLHHCRALVFPSCQRSEAFGMTLLEAAMHSRPMISCEIGTGTSYVNKADETGLVVPPCDPLALAAAMASLEADDALCQRLGRAARERFEQYFQGAAVGKSYIELYRNVIDQAA